MIRLIRLVYFLLGEFFCGTTKSLEDWNLSWMSYVYWASSTRVFFKYAFMHLLKFCNLNKKYEISKWVTAKVLVTFDGVIDLALSQSSSPDRATFWWQ